MCRVDVMYTRMTEPMESPCTTSSTSWINVSGIIPVTCAGKKNILQTIQMEGEYGYGRIEVPRPSSVRNDTSPDVAVIHESTNTTCSCNSYLRSVSTWR